MKIAVSLTDEDFWKKSTELSLSEKEVKKLLADSRVSILRDEYLNTPLHLLAVRYREALKHPDVSKIKNKHGNTPLHWAARSFKEARQHPDIDKVRNKKGETPKTIYEFIADLIGEKI